MVLTAIVILLTGVTSSQSQPTRPIESTTMGDCIECNLRDASGKKFGLWIEVFGHEVRKAYYKEDTLHGVCRVYARKSGELLLFGEYSHGEECGTWFRFDDNGHLSYSWKDISRNTDLYAVAEVGGRFLPRYKCRLTNYHPNGIVAEEGLALYDESVENDEYKSGRWNYYDTNGKLLKSEDY